MAQQEELPALPGDPSSNVSTRVRQTLHPDHLELQLQGTDPSSGLQNTPTHPRPQRERDSHINKKS